MRKEKDKLIKLKNKAENEVKHLPKGKLRCTKSNGCHQYYLDGKYVSKDQRELIGKIAKRNYLEKLLEMLARSIKAIDYVEKYYETSQLDNVYNSMCPGRRQLVEPITETLKQKIEKFMAQTYEPLSFKENDTSEYYSNNGERVRSKSEKLIADELSNRGIPYKYEMPLTLETSGRTVIFRPDFTIMNKRTGKRYILEHLGMLDNPDYLNHALDKINIYEKNGYLLGDKLIILHETSMAPLSTNVMKSYIERYFE
ncbi:MAG: hypothetical protein MJ134_07075 [Lachnospiraceae bacterium]|nr:hypothetical protein [Lachnospiraceae bacterium]